MNKSQKYWRSLAELEQTPEFQEFLHREFPVAASEFPTGISRRRWLQLMGASLALGGLSGCRWPTEKITPLAVRPENRVPGEPQFFATSVELAGAPQHLLVTSIDGRPIKVEGNPDHPGSRGATNRFAQASLLGLYDPDRSETPFERQDGQRFSRTWDEFEKFAREHFSAERMDGGASLAILIEPTSSLAVHRQLAKMRERFPEAVVYAYAAVSDEQRAQATQLASGSNLRLQPRLRTAKVIAALDADLLGGDPDAVTLAYDFAAGRDPESGEMSRLYAIESQYSVTGAAADHRLPVRSSDIGTVLMRLHDLVQARINSTSPASATEAQSPEIEEFLDVLAEDLCESRGRGLVAVGPHQPATVQAAALSLNQLLGNLGKTLLCTDDPHRLTPAGNLAELTDRMSNGEVQTLLILGGNPVYNAPVDLQFGDALSRVETSIHLSLYEDETSRKCVWHLPLAHAYESWGDVRAWDGTISVSQPLIEPLLNGKSVLEITSLLLAETATPVELVRTAIADAIGRSLSDSDWKQLLHDGFLRDSQLPPRDVQIATPSNSANELSSPDPEASKSLEVVFMPSESVDDGRFANNGWLQEMPHFLTKLTWDNAALISPQTAREFELTQGSVVRLELSGRSVELPVYILPGQAVGSIGVQLGYGRTAAGHVGGNVEQGIDPVGVDVNAIRTWQHRDIAVGAKLESVDRNYDLATTQDHHAIDRLGLEEIGHRVGELVREASLDHYREHPDFVQHAQHEVDSPPLWSQPSVEGHAWGMSIDLTKCIGCNACVIACQAENNVPIVGKEQVSRGREMHWLRVDRYFTGDVDNPQIASQPVTCQQCENAPCEQVCPVAATVHSREGLNDMVYNRCIGTRYCANNCPYKVRRFNFFDYRKDLEEPNRQLAQLVINPEVTVRSRGVMEKCTFCVQRIQAGKIDARNERRSIADGEIKTACQQACPTRAIEFGDLNQKDSRVAQQHANPRAYGMLAELNVKPRVRYLARIRNPHPRLAAHNETHEAEAHA